MKLTVVGHWGGYPAAKGATSCYLLEKDDFSLIIDMGSGALSKLQTYINVIDINAVVLSHYHTDHMADIGVLQHARLVQAYLHGHTDILPIYGHAEDIASFNTLSHEYTSGVIYQPKKELIIGPFTINLLQTKHSVPCYAMRISDGQQTIVYTADTAYFDDLILFAQGANLLITDCNFYADQSDQAQAAGHMTSAQGAYIAQQADVHELILSHLPHFGDHKQLIKEAKQIFTETVYLAEEGFVWQTS